MRRPTGRRRRSAYGSMTVGMIVGLFVGGLIVAFGAAGLVKKIGPEVGEQASCKIVSALESADSEHCHDDAADPTGANAIKIGDPDCIQGGPKNQQPCQAPQTCEEKYTVRCANHEKCEPGTEDNGEEGSLCNGNNPDGKPCALDRSKGCRPVECAVPGEVRDANGTCGPPPIPCFGEDVPDATGQCVPPSCPDGLTRDEGKDECVDLRIVNGCDPFTGVSDDVNIDDLLDKNKYKKNPDDLVLGALWTPWCEPTNTTGNGSCFLSERESVVSVTAGLEYSKWLDAGVSAGFDLTWVMLRQNKNDGTTDFLSFFIQSPKVKVTETVGNGSASGSASLVKAKFGLYRALNEPPAGAGMNPDELEAALTLYGQFLLNVGGKDEAELGLPDPFLTGNFDGGAVGMDVNSWIGRTVSASYNGWQGPYTLDLAGAAPGNSQAQPVTLQGDIIKMQPGLVTTKAPWGDLLKGNSATAGFGTIAGLELDQLDMSSIKSVDGVEQSASIEMVIRAPYKGYQNLASARGAQESGGQAGLSGQVGAYAAIRYTKKVDLVEGRTPDAAANLILWNKIKTYGDFSRNQDSAYGAIEELFGPDGNAAIQLYFGVGGSLGAEGSRQGQPIDKPTWLKGSLGVSLAGRQHWLQGAWYHTPGARDDVWQQWDSCRDFETTDPARFDYGPDFQNLFDPKDGNVFHSSDNVLPVNNALGRLETVGAALALLRPERAAAAGAVLAQRAGEWLAEQGRPLVARALNTATTRQPAVARAAQSQTAAPVAADRPFVSKVTRPTGKDKEDCSKEKKKKNKDKNNGGRGNDNKNRCGVLCIPPCNTNPAACGAGGTCLLLCPPGGGGGDVGGDPTADFVFDCPSRTCAFRAEGSTAVSPADLDSWTWEFGDQTSNSTDGDETAHTYAQPGTYAVKLTVTDSDGNRAAITKQVTVTEPAVVDPVVDDPVVDDPVVDDSETDSPDADDRPTATFKPNCTDLTCTFDASESAAQEGQTIAVYQWEFATDGARGSGAVVEYTYPGPGTYTVALDVTDSRGLVGSFGASVTVPDNVVPQPEITVTCTALECLFTGVDAAATPDGGPVDSVSAAWDFGDGQQGLGSSPIHAYGDSGIFEVTLTLIDNVGHVGVAHATVAVAENACIVPETSADVCASFADGIANILDAWYAPGPCTFESFPMLEDLGLWGHELNSKRNIEMIAQCMAERAYESYKAVQPECPTFVPTFQAPFAAELQGRDEYTFWEPGLLSGAFILDALIAATKSCGVDVPLDLVDQSYIEQLTVLLPSPDAPLAALNAFHSSWEQQINHLTMICSPVPFFDCIGGGDLVVMVGVSLRTATAFVRPIGVVSMPIDDNAFLDHIVTAANANTRNTLGHHEGFSFSIPGLAYGAKSVALEVGFSEPEAQAFYEKVLTLMEVPGA